MKLTQEQLSVIYEYEQILRSDENIFWPFYSRSEYEDGEYRLTEDGLELFDTDEAQQELYEKHLNALIFAYKVDEISNGNFNKGDKIKVCDTPNWLQKLGFKDLPIYYSSWHISNALKEKNDEIEYSNNGHGLSVQQVQSLPFILEKMPPAVLLDNSSRKDCMLMVIPTIDKDNLPIIASIKPNAELHGLEIEGIETNMLMTVFGKEHFDDFIKNNFSKEDYIYVNSVGVQHLRNVTDMEIIDKSLDIPEGRVLKTPKCIENVYGYERANNISIFSNAKEDEEYEQDHMGEYYDTKQREEEMDQTDAILTKLMQEQTITF